MNVLTTSRMSDCVVVVVLCVLLQQVTVQLT